MPKRRFTLKLSLSGAFALVVALSGILLGVAAYEVARTYFRTALNAKIQSSALLAAQLLDPVELASITRRTDEETPAYAHLRGLLQTIKSTSPEIRFIYTLRNTPEGLKFILDAETDPSLRSAPGDIYTEATPSIHQFFKQTSPIYIEKDFTKDKWGSFLSSYAAIGDPAKGFTDMVGVDVDASFVINGENDLAKVVAGCALLTILLVLLISQYVSDKMSRSILILTDEVRRIQNLNLNETPPHSSTISEIDELGNALGAMKRGLKSFKKYVPSDIVNDLLQQRKEAVLGTEKKHLTIMFTDIADFTTISEHLTSDQLATCMADYLSIMTRVIKEHQGTIDKFIGDSVMAFWGAPHPCEDQAKLACETAIACHREVKLLNDRLTAAGLEPLHTRIGINTGDVIVGNIGTDERMSFTAIGDPVNVASRLESLNKYYGTSTLVSLSTLSQAAEQFLTRFVDHTIVKGKDLSTEIHELICLLADANSAQVLATHQYNSAMQAFVEGDVQKAYAGLKLLNLATPDDKLVRYQFETIEAAIGQVDTFRYQPRVMRGK